VSSTNLDLAKRLQRLAASLLPADRLIGDFPDDEQDKIHAYIVLAHAEIETYLEGLGRDTVERARRLSINSLCHPVMSRLIFLKIGISGKFETVTPDIITSACSYYETILEANHGVVRRNVLRLFMPLGLTHRDFDDGLLSDLQAFGALRGGFAHTVSRVRQGVQPSEDRSRVERIVTGLALLEQAINSLIV